MMNDPRVYMNLAGPPFPYTEKVWEEFFPIAQKSPGEALAEWKDIEKSRNEAAKAGEEEVKRWMGRVPVESLREIDPETKEQKYIGSISIRKTAFLGIKDKAERERLVAENESRKAGDPLIYWEIGCKLATSGAGWVISFLICSQVFLLPRLTDEVLCH